MENTIVDSISNALFKSSFSFMRYRIKITVLINGFFYTTDGRIKSKQDFKDLMITGFCRDYRVSGQTESGRIRLVI